MKCAGLLPRFRHSSRQKQCEALLMNQRGIAPPLIHEMPPRLSGGGASVEAESLP